MSAHVLLNLLNKLGKRDIMRGLSSILPLFPNGFNKFNNIRAQLLDFLSYDMKITLKSPFLCNKVIFLPLCTQRCYGPYKVSRKSVNHLWFSILMHGVISLLDATSYDNMPYLSQC